MFYLCLYQHNFEFHNPKQKFPSTINTPGHMRKNITEALKKEELIPIKKSKKQEKINQIFINLYNKDLASIEMKNKSICDKKQMMEKSQANN